MKATVSRRPFATIRRCRAWFTRMAADFGEVLFSDPWAILWACLRASVIVLLFMPLAGFLIACAVFILETAPGLLAVMVFVPLVVFYAVKGA